jgi:hypothetical protein
MLSFSFVVREAKTLQDSQKNVSIIWKKLHYAKESAPMGGGVLR